MGDGLIAERKLPNPSTFESGIVGNLGNNRDYRGGGGHKIYKARHFLLCLLSIDSNET